MIRLIICCGLLLAGQALALALVDHANTKLRVTDKTGKIMDERWCKDTPLAGAQQKSNYRPVSLKLLLQGRPEESSRLSRGRWYQRRSRCKITITLVARDSDS